MTAFLRIPPFPGHRAGPIAVAGSGAALDRSQALRSIKLLREYRVGGSFWAAQPELPPGRDMLLVPETDAEAAEMLKEANAKGSMARCVLLAKSRRDFGSTGFKAPIVEGPIDPWFLANSFVEIWANADQEIGLAAALSGTPVRLFGSGRFAGCNQGTEGLISTVAEILGAGLAYRCPFSGTNVSPIEAILLLAEWRNLIDRNRDISGVAGIAHWKRPTVDPLLWGGSALPRHISNITAGSKSGAQVVAWKSRTGAALLDRLNRAPAKLVEIEDGMIRGPGLGANCVPPLSVVVDPLGIYFDPSAPSELEHILETAELDAGLVSRAARLRQRIVAGGISKYEAATESRGRDFSGRRSVLVVGQVEDDRSVLSGGCGRTNMELLVRARELEPDSWIIYRPHPDVEAGHRKGHVPDELALRHADQIDRTSAIVTIIDSVDSVHCITSLAGFEALLRGKKVTAHGVPFYAGWGMTHDMAEIPARRTRVRTVDELVAATLILYPRYLDPVTRLPCPPEVLVDRIAKGEAHVAAPLSGVRRLQGKLKLALRSILRNAA